MPNGSHEISRVDYRPAGIYKVDKDYKEKQHTQSVISASLFTVAILTIQYNPVGFTRQLL